jgi:hypothetical protein
MLDLKIDRMRLSIANAIGHEHRVRPILIRALELLRMRLRHGLLVPGARLDHLNLETLRVEPLKMDLRVLSDEVVAEKVAEAMFTAVRARWQEG